MIYKLGGHIIAQGDSTDLEFVSRVAKGLSIRSVIADPPYGVAYVENKDWVGLRGPSMEGKGSTRHKAIEGDQEQTGEEYAEFTRKWIGAIKPHLAPKNSFYIFNSDVMACALRAGMKAADVYCSQFIIWVKNSIVLGRKDYNPQHELIAYGWHGAHKFERHTAKSVLFCPKPAKAKLHPTMKPVELLRKLIANSTKVGEWVCDPFLGSGSTLIACEHLKRRCLGIELDEEYVKTAVARWEKLTGLKAVLMDKGEKQATTRNHVGRLEDGQRVATSTEGRAKKAEKINTNRV
jgi:DNA modification methylase